MKINKIPVEELVLILKEIDKPCYLDTDQVSINIGGVSWLLEPILNKSNQMDWAILEIDDPIEKYRIEPPVEKYTITNLCTSNQACDRFDFNKYSVYESFLNQEITPELINKLFPDEPNLYKFIFAKGINTLYELAEETNGTLNINEIEI